jgi:hypothetical protein
MPDTTAASTTPQTRRTDELLVRLAERLGAQLATSTVYGTAVERVGPRTLVPLS